MPHGNDLFRSFPLFPATSLLRLLPAATTCNTGKFTLSFAILPEVLNIPSGISGATHKKLYKKYRYIPSHSLLIIHAVHRNIVCLESSNSSLTSSLPQCRTYVHETADFVHEKYVMYNAYNIYVPFIMNQT